MTSDSAKKLSRDPSLDGYALNVDRSKLHAFVGDVEAVVTQVNSVLDIALRLFKVIERRLLKLDPKQAVG